MGGALIDHAHKYFNMASITVARVAPQMIRSFHSSPSFRAPPIWLATPVGRFLVAFSARIARSVWKRLPQGKRLRIKSAIKRQRRYLYGAGGLCLTGGVVYYYTHLEFLSLTKRHRFMMYSRDDICQLLRQEINTTPDGGLDVRTLTGDKKILPANHKYYDTVLPIIRQIVTHNTWCDRLNDIQWRIAIVDDDQTANALSLPTGDIIVYTGMLQACQNIDEAGLMLSHEMSHVILDHGVETISHSGFVSMLGLVCIAAIWFFIPSDLISFFMHKLFNGTVEILVNNKYNRKLELEADQVGLLLASKACFNPERAVKLWTHLPMFNESDKVMEYLQTHPCNERRFLILQSLLPQARELYTSSRCEAVLGKEIKLFASTIGKFLGL